MTDRREVSTNEIRGKARRESLLSSAPPSRSRGGLPAPSPLQIYTRWIYERFENDGDNDDDGDGDNDDDNDGAKI